MPAAKKSKKPKPIVSRPSRSDIATARERLRYMMPEEIAKDFPDTRSKKAIAAVFQWLSLNSTVAWQLPSGNYSNALMSAGKIRHSLGSSDALILDEERYEHARKLLCQDE